MVSKTIDKEKCTGCMLCEEICANSHVITKGEDGYPAFTNEMMCIACGHCFAICPERAITFTFSPGTDQAEVVAPGAPIQYPNEFPDADTIGTFLFSTRSDRLYADKPVEKEKIEKVIEAMMRAPSAGNEQNKHYYVFTDPAKIAEIESLQKAYFRAVLNKYNSPLAKRSAALTISMNAKGSGVPLWTRYKNNLALTNNASFSDNSSVSYLKGAKVLLVITHDKKKGMHQSFYQGDIRIAGTYGILMAKALGLASCWMGLLEIAMGKSKKIGEAMHIGSHESMGGALVLGYSDTQWVGYPPRGPVTPKWQ
jgi:nitroreductase/NAD-dependent dihydropyrimidine dehydrogenase PreA subunit